MKTLLVLTLLVALVGLGVWNSPKVAHEPAAVAWADLHGKVLSNELIAEHADMLLQTSAVEIGSSGTTSCLVFHPDGQQCKGDGKGGYITHD